MTTTTAPSVGACHFCGKRVSPSAKDVALLVTGWIERRKAGGANAVRLPGPAQALAHQYCLDREAERDASRQAGLPL